MAAERATAPKEVLQFQNAQEQGLPLQIKMDEGNKQGGRLKGTPIIQPGKLTNILGWMGSEQKKQEPDEELPQCWDHLKLVQSPLLGWGNPQQPDEFMLRQQEVKRREQQVPVLFEDMDVQSPEAEHALLDRRQQQLLREAQAGLEREASSLVVGSITPIHNFHKMSRRGTNWSHGEVIDLLDIWGEQRIQQVLLTSHRNMDTFQVIANEMAKRGHERTPQECRTKTKTLRRDYKKVKENNMAGKEPMTCPFYDELDRIMESALPPLPERMPNFMYQEEPGGDNPLPYAPGEGGPHKESEDCHQTQDQCDPPAQFSTELVDSVDSGAVVSKAQNIFEEPEGTPQLTIEADPVPNPVSPATQSIPGSPDTVSSTADVHVSPPQSPLPGPTGLSAAERLANLRSRHKKTRNDLALDLAKAADRRMQLATEKIILALDDYAKADQEDREKHRVGTEQIISIMNRQTELLELLVRQQPRTPAAGPSSSRHAWSPRVGQASLRPAGSSSSRFGISRRLLMARARNRRRPQNISP
ncbi:uncharacterized protein LOC121921940 [Sceloporus undulatus]|uniref:uncharacterized protein LOC121921940 n=1 Tax=Sceloporus undulatus TaxID=8520 RepID=UPI001C4C31FE|nr:uncharacterized protein LOC121921940 [Sceloporus undulatus]XP_042306638.1 uncharacterized protein LOC121921940 [Sceloporus undulatus]XP_042306639.1 uncharacterized protein LOC121921940 [Sceloporus undulatus]